MARSKREASAKCASDSAAVVTVGRLEYDYDPPRGFVRVRDGAESALVNPTVSDLLRAISEAFDVRIVPADAIVIERGDLPTVATDNGSPYAAPYEGAVPIGVTGTDTAESIRAHALARLALAEHLREHPPVDEAQVEALIGELRAADVERTGQSLMDSDYHQIALRLLSAGVRVEVRHAV